MHCNCSHLLKPSSFRKNQTQRDGDRTTGLPQMIVTEGRLISFPLLRTYELKTRMQANVQSREDGQRETRLCYWGLFYIAFQELPAMTDKAATHTTYGSRWREEMMELRTWSVTLLRCSMEASSLALTSGNVSACSVVTSQGRLLKPQRGLLINWAHRQKHLCPCPIGSPVKLCMVNWGSPTSSNDKMLACGEAGDPRGLQGTLS